jgi:broad specificity phosphatase PhoE
MTTLLVARHGQTDWNLERRWQGHADPPLNKAGREQARALAESISARRIDEIWSSDLMRARETAEICSARLGVAMRLDSRLREVDVGEWSGLTTPEIERLYPDGLRRRRAGGTGWEMGETYEAMGARIIEALRELARASPVGRLLVITHGGPLSSVWLACGGELATWRPAGNCDLDEIAIEDGGMRWIHSSRGGLHEQVQG